MDNKPFGGSNPTMYIVEIKHPTTLLEPYHAECNDLMEALDMTPAEANIFKAVWRIAQARRGRAKPGAGGLYDAQKIEFFARRVLVREKNLDGTASKASAACHWAFDEGDGTWVGDCGVMWVLNHDTPAENRMNYCPQCGSPLAIDHESMNEEADL